MHKRARNVDPNLITVLLIAVIAALPFLTRPGLPRHTDLELHVFRAAEYGKVLRDGVLYPRWAPDFFYGYGYPIFNYYAPFTYALAGLFAIPFGVVAGVKGVILLGYVLGASGTFIFTRRHFGSTAGVLASAAFVLSPYFLFVEPLMRGDLAEFFALSLLPWVFVAFDEPARSARKIAARSTILAVLIFSHNLMALVGSALLIAYLVWRGLVVDRPPRWAADALSIGLSIGLTAIFWLPFVVERTAVRLDVAGPGHFDYHNHFIPLAMLLSPSPALDFGATAPKYIYNLGLIQWLCWPPALVWSLIKRREAAAKVSLFFAVIAASLTFLILPAAMFIWDAVPAAAYVQFPWRLLGPVAFALAVCIGATARVEGAKSEEREVKGDPAPLAHARPSTGRSVGRPARSEGASRGRGFRIPHSAFRITHHSLLIIIFLALLITALPTMYPPTWAADFGDTSPRGMIDFELSGVALGTTSTSDFLPTPVGMVPPANQALLDSYSSSVSSSVIDKLDHSALPGGAQSQAEGHTAIYDRFRIDSPVDFRARLFTFLFPGWHVYVDGREVLIKPEDQSGLVTFPVPAGSHLVEVQLQLTGPQLTGTLISLGALVLIGVMLIRGAGGKGRGVTSEDHASPIIRHSSLVIAKHPIGTRYSLLITSLLFLAARVLIFDRCDTCFRYTSPPGQVLGAQFKQMAHLGGHIDLLGYDLVTVNVEAGGTLPLTLYWRATAPVPTNYQVFAHLSQPGAAPWGQSDKLNPGDFPTTRWPLDKYVWDDHVLSIRPDTPAGDYVLSVGLYTLGDGKRAPVLDDNGQIIGDSVTLDTIVHVTPPH
jgi:hypothetical protein